VATRVGGVPEIVSHEETALLVQSRNPGEMAAAIQRMLEDSPLRKRLAHNALQLAGEKYSPEAYRRSLVQMYEEVLAVPRYG
jgi:glycosyltransferase involved in cell wall biosynthesis